MKTRYRKISDAVKGVLTGVKTYGLTLEQIIKCMEAEGFFAGHDSIKNCVYRMTEKKELVREKRETSKNRYSTYYFLKGEYEKLH